MPTVLLNKKSHPQRQNIFQNQTKHIKNGESHGGVRQDKYADSRVRGASDQPVTLSDPARTSVSNTETHRTKKRSRPGRLSQLATWVEDPIVFKVRKLARDKNLSMSRTLRSIVIKGLSQEEGDLNQALDIESLQERNASDNRRFAKRLTRLLVMILFDVGHTKVVTTNLLGMQKGMTGDMLKDILTDADRQTKRRLSRKYPDLNEFVEAIEQWLLAEEEDQASRQAGSQKSGGETNPDSLGANGHSRRGGRHL
jgi:hypothetical protein